MSISVVIPTLNEDTCLLETLRAVSKLPDILETIVVDGGSTDNTLAIAESSGAKVLSVCRGRGAQLAAGAQMAHADVLWFVHADALPPPEGPAQISNALRDPTVAGGNFSLRFGYDCRGAHFINCLYPKLSFIGLCYGDSGFFVRQCVYKEIGGFSHLPLFEDLDFLRRLRRVGRFVHLPATIWVSPRRFADRNFELVFFRWMALQLLYWIGISPNLLSRAYPQVRGNSDRSSHCDPSGSKRTRVAR